MIKTGIMAVLVLVSFFVLAQNNQYKAVFKSYEPGFYYDSILKDGVDYERSQASYNPQKYFAVDCSRKKFPTNFVDYKTSWHNKPVSQGNSGTCWCYSATSFFESEVFRLTGKQVKLSEMYTVYWEYVIRAMDFVQTRGETYFSQGSESNAVPRIWKLYGIVPYSEYPGKDKERKYNSHDKMFDEMDKYLASVKKNNLWDEDVVLANIRSILNSHMGEPPVEFTVDRKKLTPKEYLNDVLKLNMNDYFSFMSTSSENFFEMHELVEPDNWWHADNYYNLPIEDYFNLILKTIESGYTISICGDVSEPGYDASNEVAIIPDWDIPAKFINNDSRQLRLNNGSTTDDHCIHLVGVQKFGEEYWFVVKDSGSGGFDGPNRGYRFYQQDYIKLKMMNILIHKETAKPILDKIIK